MPTTGNSDHCAITVTVETNVENQPMNDKARPNWKKANYVAIRKDLSKQKWETVMARGGGRRRTGTG
jgi:hypothetical protein